MTRQALISLFRRFELDVHWARDLFYSHAELINQPNSKVDNSQRMAVKWLSNKATFFFSFSRRVDLFWQGDFRSVVGKPKHRSECQEEVAGKQGYPLGTPANPEKLVFCLWALRGAGGPPPAPGSLFQTGLEKSSLWCPGWTVSVGWVWLHQVADGTVTCLELRREALLEEKLFWKVVILLAKMTFWMKKTKKMPGKTTSKRHM